MADADSGWLKALTLPLRVMSGIALSSLVLIGLDVGGLLDLSALWPHTKAVVIVAAVVSSMLTLTGLAGLIYDDVQRGLQARENVARSAMERLENAEKEKRERETAAERLAYLTGDEVRLLAGCLKSNSQSFTTWVHSSAAAMLIAKKLVYSPSGSYHADHFPFVIYDHVWQAMLTRKVELLAQDETYLKEIANRPKR